MLADVKVAQGLTFAPGTIVVDDRGDNDYRLFARWTIEGLWFITRMKANAVDALLEDHPVSLPRHVRKDQTIGRRGVGAVARCAVRFRCIDVWNPEKEEVLILLTNQFGLGATTIAIIDEDRWQIDLCFTALKQNGNIKTFVGASANAVKSQVWTA